jgi:hypothetical protein
LARALAFAAGAAMLTAAQLNLPKKEFWDRRVLWAAIAVVAYVTVHDLFVAALPSLQAKRVREYEQNVRATLSAGLCEVVNKFGVSWEEVGVHAFLIRGLPHFRRLVNVGGIRLGAKPSMTAPIWRPQKGVVGVSWDKDCIVAVDWQSFYKTHNGAGKAAWKKLSVEDRYGLTWGEFQLTADYNVIVASPIYCQRGRSGQRMGCVVIDAPLTLAQANDPGMAQILRDVARMIELAGDPPQTWWTYRLR